MIALLWIVSAGGFAFCGLRAWQTWEPWHDGKIIRRYAEDDFAMDMISIGLWLVSCVACLLLMFVVWEVCR